MDFMNIGKILNGVYYAVPDYQRDYEWTNDENESLLEDIFSTMISSARDKEFPHHFMGAIVTIPYDTNSAGDISIKTKDYKISNDSIKYIVDGQQRLISFSVLFQSIFDLINEDGTISDEDKDYYKNIFIRPFLFGRNRNEIKKCAAPNLLLKGNTGRYYNCELLKNKDGNDKINKRLKGATRLSKAYLLFESEISKKCDEMQNQYDITDHKSFYDTLLNTISSKFDFVEIACDSSLNAFQVFESLNGKGLDLTAVDRIKNIFISWCPKEGYIKWNRLEGIVNAAYSSDDSEYELPTIQDFLANFFVSLLFYEEGKRISKQQLPDQFRKTYCEKAKNDFENFYNNLFGWLKKYTMLRTVVPSKNISDETTSDIFCDYRDLGVNQVYVLLFSIIKHYMITDIDKNADFKKLNIALRRLVVRMQVCNRSFNKLDELFIECIVKIKDNKQQVKIIDIANDIEKKANTITDGIFKNSFIEFCPQKNRVSEFYCRHIENYLRKDPTRECNNRTEVPRKLTVEHIIPQALDLISWYGTQDNVDKIPEEIKEEFNEKIINSIGNKALLYGDDNTAASNKSYQEKIQIYKNGKRGQNQGTPIGTFEMIKDLVVNYPQQFLHTEVLKRAEELSEYAIKIW